MNITKHAKDIIENWLEDFHYVRWDRAIPLEEHGVASIFGWIDRDDGKKDFVLIEASLNTGEMHLIGTSSKEWSEKIAQELGDEHTDCVRVEDHFDINNSIKLNKNGKEI